MLPLLAAACTDEKIVYREPFNPPPDAEAGFVGYFTTSDKSTTCGNCHVDHENKWRPPTQTHMPPWWTADTSRISASVATP
jgi:hypothetical protein